MRATLSSLVFFSAALCAHAEDVPRVPELPRVTSSVSLLPRPDGFRDMMYHAAPPREAFNTIMHWLKLDRLDLGAAGQFRMTRPQYDSDNAWSVDSLLGADKSMKSLVLAFDGEQDDGMVQDILPVGADFHPYDNQDEKFTSAGILNSLIPRARSIFGAEAVTTTGSAVASSDLPLEAWTITSSSSSTAAQTFMSELGPLGAFLDADASTSTFGAFRISLGALRDLKREDNSAYEEAASVVRAAVRSIIAQSIRAVIIVTPHTSTYTLAARQESDDDETRQPPQQPLPPTLPPSHPIFSSSSCFTSADTCMNGTSSCSGRGSCVGVSRAGRQCFACACRPTISRGTSTTNPRKTVWVGDKCQKIDVSGPFVLLVGTTVGLLLLVGGSIYVLASVGGDKLPSVLGSVAVPGMKE